MSANKTIKALREERTQLYAEIRRLQVNAGLVPTMALINEPERVRDEIDKEFLRIKGLTATFDPAAPGTDRTVLTTFQGGQVVDVQQVARAPAIEWRDAPKDATHARYSTQWFKGGTGSDPCYWWSSHRCDWYESLLTSAQLLDDPRLVARPAPAEAWSLEDKDGHWNYDSLHELIRDTYSPVEWPDDMKPGRVVYRAHKRYDDPAGYVPDADEVIEHMGNRAYESDAGEWADGYPDLKDEARAALDVALEPLKAWARKYADPSHFTVHDITPHTITDEDIQAAMTAQAGAQ